MPAKPVSVARTSQEWIAERSRLESELQKLAATISEEYERRKTLTVKAYQGDERAEREYNSSCETDGRLRREVEKLNTLIDHAGDQIRAAEAEEHEARERIRLEKLRTAQDVMLAAATRIDGAVADLQRSLTDFDGAAKIVQSLGGNTPKHRAVLGGALRFNPIIADRLRSEWPTVLCDSAFSLTQIFVSGSPDDSD